MSKLLTAWQQTENFHPASLGLSGRFTSVIKGGLGYNKEAWTQKAYELIGWHRGTHLGLCQCMYVYVCICLLSLGPDAVDAIYSF